MSTPDITGLLARLAQYGPQAATAKGRQAALSIARSLVNALESPGERIARMSWYEPLLHAACRIGIDLKLFTKLQAAGDAPKTCNELAKETDCDSVLLSRILKHLATAEIVKEVGPDTYTRTAVSDLLATPEGSGSLVNCFSGVSKINSRAVEYFRTKGYKNPVDKDDSMWMFGAGTDKHYFDWVFGPDNQEEAEAFLNHMKFKTLGMKWYEGVPVDQVLGTSCSKDDVLMVDVGGNTGYDILGFHKAYPNIPGRLIVQDLPQSIDAIDAEEIKPIEPMAHNFFTEQPVKGAKAYYLKMILHDWPDKACHDILSKLKPALKPGYSKILINEIVVPEQGANWFETGVDMLMMWTHSGAERREKHWHNLIEGAGLKLVKIWPCGEAPEKLIEVELP